MSLTLRLLQQRQRSQLHVAINQFTRCVFMTNGPIPTTASLPKYCRSISNTNTPQSTDSSDVELSYTIYPDNKSLIDASKTPLIFSHGLFGAKGNVHSIAKHLSSDGRKVITYDARNHGDSGHTKVMNFPCMSEDMNDLIKELNLNQPIVLGHSMGGRTAMTLALSKPESLSTLIVVDISPQAKPQSYVAFKDYTIAMKNVKIPHGASIVQARKSAELQLSSTVPEKGVLAFLLTNLREFEDGTIRWRVNLDAIINNYNDIISFPQTDSKAFHKPTLFVFGANSAQYQDRDADLIKKLFPLAQTEVIAEAGHFVHAEKPLQFTQIVKDFLKSIEK